MMNRRAAFAFALLSSLLPTHAPALLIGDNGPEPIFLEIKPSLRLSLDFDAELQALAAVEAQLGLTVLKRFVGPKYIEMLAFPGYFTGDQAVAAIQILQRQTAVEKIAALSASNLVFLSGDFAQVYLPNETIPEAVRRGLDRGPTPPFDPSIVLQPHVKNEFIVAWKPEFIWNAEQTGFLQHIAEFNGSMGCHVVGVVSASPTDLTQVLAFPGSDALLARKLQSYLSSGLVQYAQPDFLVYGANSLPLPPRGFKAVRRDQGGRTVTGRLRNDE